MRLATQRYGDGPRQVALVHGLGAEGALWRGLVERIVAGGGVTVTTVDLRGHGLSGRADGYGLDAFADDLVETLPAGLDLVVGHSLGGTVLERAVARLRPAAALYLDPGFRLSLPASGLWGRLFWATAPLSLVPRVLAQRWRGRGRARPGADDLALRETATARFDRGMTLAVLRDVAHQPVRVEAPAVPSTVLLSDDAPEVVGEAVADGLAAAGWRVRRLRGVGHDLWLEDPDRTWDAVRDVLLGVRPHEEPAARSASGVRTPIRQSSTRSVAALEA